MLEEEAQYHLNRIQESISHLAEHGFPADIIRNEVEDMLSSLEESEEICHEPTCDLAQIEHTVADIRCIQYQPKEPS